MRPVWAPVPNSRPIPARQEIADTTFNRRMDLFIINDKLVNYLSSNGSQLLKEMPAPGRELVSVRLHNLFGLRIEERRTIRVLRVGREWDRRA
jgi:hypothetical protein